MRAIIPTFFLFAASFSALAEIQSASEYTQGCVNDRIAQCINSKPQTDPGQAPDTSACTSDAMMTSINKTCSSDTQAFCQTFTDLLAEPSPVPGTTIQVPSGCSSSASTKPQKPGGGTPNDKPDLAAAQADLQKCTSAGQSAAKCCGDPASCGGKSVSDDLQKLDDTVQSAQQDGNQDSLNQICSQAQTAADTSGDLQLSYANVCASKHVPCSDVCGQVWNKWNQTANSCQGDSCSQLSSIVAQMWQQQTKCDQLNASEQILKDKANQEALNSQISQICQARVPAAAPPPADPSQPPSSTLPSSSIPSDTVANPSPMLNQPFQQMPQLQQPMQMAPQQPVAAATPSLPVGSSECGSVGNISACVNCAEHPEFPSCGGSASPTSATQVARNDTGSAPAGIPNATGMNVNGTLPAQGFDPSSANPQNPAAPANPAMDPNAMNGSSGGIGVFPPLDKNNLSGSLLSRAHYLAEKKGIAFEFKGERSGNGFAGYANGTAGSGFEKVRRSLASSGFPFAVSGKNYSGLDLKRYLPGQFGSSRGISGMGLANSEIGPMSTDMFQRVSLRFKLICFQHQLIDCN
jgi:hypothetical protein